MAWGYDTKHTYSSGVHRDTSRSYDMTSDDCGCFPRAGDHESGTVIQSEADTRVEGGEAQEE